MAESTNRNKTNPSNSVVQNLLAQSRVLTEANIKKCSRERILEELTLFQNLSSIIYGGRSDARRSNRTDSDYSSVSKILKIEVKVTPGCVKFGDFGSSNEILVLSVSNVSKNFTFNPEYWTFVVEIGSSSRTINPGSSDPVCLKDSTNWSLERPLSPGSTEKFSTYFSSNSNGSSSIISVRTRLIFSLEYNSQSFLKSVDVSLIQMDILYLLSGARTSREIMTPNIPDSRSSIFEQFESKESKTFPPVTQFFLQFDALLMTYFLENILFANSAHRGFCSEEIKGLTTTTPTEESGTRKLSFYYLEEEILLIIKSGRAGPRSDIETMPSSNFCNTVSFKCSNMRVLFALKVAILRRLARIENLKVSCPDDSECEKLLELKLNLEELAKPGSGCGPASARSNPVNVDQLMDLYLELRDIGEKIQFILLTEVE